MFECVHSCLTRIRPFCLTKVRSWVLTGDTCAELRQRGVCRGIELDERGDIRTRSHIPIQLARLQGCRLIDGGGAGHGHVIDL